eukprot:TRINITY_DN6274_c0_g1_i1.p1 TRINITY_DN6274_c0_g1~~TRINITY_DN6274_c0_g1_i1.p1  ORF type:complete len:493 (-),score=106.67 TRINITY_DN6274_c0_g1_i1:1-1326(-)
MSDTEVSDLVTHFVSQKAEQRKKNPIPPKPKPTPTPPTPPTRSNSNPLPIKSSPAKPTRSSTIPAPTCPAKKEPLPTNHDESSEDDDDEEDTVCRICQREFKSARGVRQHMTRSHKGETIATPKVEEPQPKSPEPTPSPSPEPKKSKAKKSRRRAPSPDSDSDSYGSEDDVDEESPASSPVKKKSRKAAPKATPKPKPVQEHRPARFVSSRSKATSDRINRALSQRMYLASREEISETERHFAVLGSVGNIYTVVITDLPHCSCPDFERGHLCKHILFVYLKVLRVDPSSSIIYQKGLLPSEIKFIFENAPKDPTKTVMANSKVQKAYNSMTQAEETEEVDENLRKNVEGEDCAICYETMSKKEKTVWCRTCGNNVHEACWKQWASAKKGQPITCVYCRADWEPSGKKGGKSKGGVSINEGYVNMAKLQGMSKEREEYTPW